MEALKQAAIRGVSVNIITTSRTTSVRSMMPYDNAHRWYDRLEPFGVHLWETFHNEHEKIFVADGEVACTGSYNIELAAEEKLVEQMTWSSDPAFVKQLRDKLVDVIHNACILHTAAVEPPMHWYDYLNIFHWLYVAFAYLLRKDV